MRPRILWALALCLPVIPCFAADAPKSDAVGVEVGARFAMPVSEAGKRLENRCWVEQDSSGKAVIHVVYVDAAGKIGEIFYDFGKRDGPKPDPGPNPKPDPKPDPLPIPTVLWGIVVEESSTRTPEQAEVLTSPKVRALFTNGNFRLIDPTDDAGKPNPVPVELQPYVDRAKGQTLPQLYVVDDKGRVYSEGVLPKTVAEVEALVAKIKGGGK